MAYLFKDTRGKSKYWYCGFTLPSGARTTASTKQVSLKEAKKIMRAIESKNEAAKTKYITQAQIAKDLNIILEDMGQTPVDVVKTGDYLTRWLTDVKPELSKSSYVGYKAIIETFIKSLGDKARLPLIGITPREIEAFKRQMMAGGRSPTTVNKQLKIVRIPFNLARRHGIILSNPAEAIDFMKKASYSREVFTQDQVCNLLAAANVEWKGMILLGVYAGLRLMDAAKITLGAFDLKERLITITPAKTKDSQRKVLKIPMSQELCDYLSALKTDKFPKTNPLFPTLCKKKRSGHSGLCTKFIRIMEQSGITDRKEQTEGVEKGTAGRKFFALSFHSLRHTYISWMANGGVSEEIRKKLAGHSSDVHEQYTHFEIESFRSAIDKMPKLKDLSKNDKSEKDDGKVLTTTKNT